MVYYQRPSTQPSKPDPKSNSRADNENTVTAPSPTTQPETTGTSQPAMPEHGKTPHADKAA